MAEIKNTFLGSKMNKDVDDRLLPRNEYRNAVNLQVNKTDNSDAGTIQNILGNNLAVNGDFAIHTGTPNLECIGIYANPATDTLFIFLTNNLDSSGTNTYNKLAKNYIYAYNTIQNTAVLLVQGAFLNFSKNFPVLGINVLENFLFWTDNRNQPRRINITKATSSPTYYTIEEQISVAKPSPLYPAELYKESEEAPGEYETSMYNVTSERLPNNTLNPYYDTGYIGDSAYLEDKFVRFSYRYKFEDGEYSIMAPFTQIAYIPKQDGYFLYQPASGSNPEVDDETSAYRSTIVGFMENKVDKVDLQIILPCPANQLSSLLKIESIEILYKDANDIAVSAIDSIPVTAPAFNTSSNVYEYVYNSKKPFKTLPNRDLVRVNDVVPIRALGQEIIGNRIVYSNYQNRFSYPKYLDYNVGYSDKGGFRQNNDSETSIIEYPNHSVKENRNYQVGVVLADKFGRESGVILSDATTSIDASQFGASSLYVKYRTPGSTAPSQFPGNALKVLFNSPITYGGEGWPGLYNGDPTSDDYNPLGWYSYKIVVKQTEQEYYNVYLPGLMAAYPGTAPAPGPTTELGKTSHAVLINDNINKVPRDLTEVGPAQLQFRSSVVLYPRVQNNTLAYNNQQDYPANTYSFVNTIATNNSLFFSDNAPATLTAGYNQFYQLDSNPLIARISTDSKLGVVSTSDVINLAVCETKPFNSKLDIYWETSTVGVISELNELIESGTSGAALMSNWTFNLSEANGPLTVVASGFTFADGIGNLVIPNSVTLSSVRDQANNDLTSKFEVISNGSGSYSLRTTAGSYFYYGFNTLPINLYSYTFVFSVNSGSPPLSTVFTQTGNLTNVPPTITTRPTTAINKEIGDINVYDFNAVNGSNLAGGNSTADLSWSVTGSSLFSITPDGLLQQLDGTAEGTFNLRITVTEATGNTDYVDVVVVYPFRKSFDVTGTTFACTDPLGGYLYYEGTIAVVGAGWEVQARSFADVGAGIVSVWVNIYDTSGVVIGFGVSVYGGNEAESPWYSLPAGNYTYDLSITAENGGGCGNFASRNMTI